MGKFINVKNSKLLLSLLLVAFLLIPTSAVAAVSMGGTSSDVFTQKYGEKSWQGYSRVEFHSDGYVNGYVRTRTTAGEGANAGWMENSAWVYAKIGNDGFLLASKKCPQPTLWTK